MAELMIRACDALATSLMQAIAARIVGNNSSALAELANCREPVDGPKSFGMQRSNSHWRVCRVSSMCGTTGFLSARANRGRR